MGFFTWNVQDNLLFGDEIFGDVYSLSSKQIATGVPVEVILDRIVVEDRGRVAETVHHGIISGEAGTLHYSVLGSDGSKMNVVAFGRCLRDADGVPSFYTGSIMLASQAVLAVATRPLEGHCRAALCIARDDGHELAARYLSSALRSLGLTDTE